MEVTNRWWCWKSKACSNLEGQPICTRDKYYEEVAYFQNECAMAKHNCARGRDFRQWYVITKSKPCKRSPRKYKDMPRTATANPLATWYGGRKIAAPDTRRHLQK